MRKCVLFFVVLFSFAVQAESITAPDWELYDAYNKLVKSSDFAGKPLVLHFWATWCPYCKKLQPGLDRIYQTHKQQGLQMIAISFWEDEGANPQGVLNERGASFKTLVDGDQVARELFGVKGTPTTIFIDHKGLIVSSTRISDPNDARLDQIAARLVEAKNNP